MSSHITRQRLEAKVAYLQQHLEDLKDYYFVPETYQLLIAELDIHQVQLKQIEIQEYFNQIDNDKEVAIHEPQDQDARSSAGELSKIPVSDNKIRASSPLG
jgi:hypothetical protein